MADCKQLYVSMKTPTAEDTRQTGNMLNTLKDFNVFGGQPEELRRLAALQKLKVLYGLWINEMSKLKKVPYVSEGQVYAFGSFQLGAYDIDADMDALFLAPQHVTRKDFFTLFLEKLTNTKGIEDINALEMCFVPVIKLFCDGIKFDMVFATLGMKTIPETFDLTDDKVLKGLNVKDMRCLHGYRVIQAIIFNLPCYESFTLALRAIKLWAKRRHIYCHAVGFLGGGAWTVLVAQICQMYPKADAATLVHKFFLVYSMWKWPIPVFLKLPDNLDLGVPVWDPRVHVSDQKHLMPILSPVYPQQNCAYNVTPSSRAIMMDEIMRGLTVTKDIMDNKAKWSKLFQAPDLFGQYKHYIVLEASAPTAQQHLEWASFVESKLRLLVGRLDKNKHVSLAHINPNPLPSLLKDANEKALSTMWVIGVQLQNPGDPVNQCAGDFLTPDLLFFTNMVHNHAVKLGMHQTGQLLAQQMNRYDLHWLLHDVKDRKNHTNRRHTEQENGRSHRAEPKSTVRGNKKRRFKPCKYRSHPAPAWTHQPALASTHQPAPASTHQPAPASTHQPAVDGQEPPFQVLLAPSPDACSYHGFTGLQAIVTAYRPHL